MMPTAHASKALNVLVVGLQDGDDELHHWIDAQARVEHVKSFTEALDALRLGPFDVVICRAADLAPPEFAHVVGSSAVLDAIPQGVCVVQPTGEVAWANAKMVDLPQDVRDRVRQCCVETYAACKGQDPGCVASVRARRFSFTTGDQETYDLTATPMIEGDKGVTRVVAVVWNSTVAGRLQETIDAIDNAGRELLSLDAEQFSRLEPHERLSLLEQKILRCTQDVLNFENFEIRVLDPNANKLELVLFAGIPADGVHVELYSQTEGNGICGYVAAKGRSYLCPDVLHDARYLPGIENARSSLTVPLRFQERTVGVANFESTRMAAFTEDDRQFAEIFARYIALALHLLELLVNERQVTTGQFGRNVMAEITAPLNDILTDVENLVEDYIGHDDLRHRLRTISGNAVRIRETVKELTAAKPGVIGARTSAARRTDPDLDGRRILLADDEEILRDTVRDVLTGYGCHVVTAADGAMAIDLLSRQKFDLVLSDIKMPVKSGYEVFAAAKHANAATPVILTTGFGYDPNHSIIRARREGLAAVLFKPFKVDQLLAEIRMALKSAAK